MRDDSILYAGTSSASFASVKVQPTLKKRREDKYEKRQLLLPSAELVFQEIENEKDSVMNVKNIDISGAKDERMFMIEMMARQRYVLYLDRLNTKLQIILKEKK